MDMHNISILLLNCFKMGVFGPKFGILDDNFPTRRHLCDNFPIAQNLGGQWGQLPPLCSTATTPLVRIRNRVYLTTVIRTKYIQSSDCVLECRYI